MVSDQTIIKLHIGGQQPLESWTIYDIEAREGVDQVGDARRLTIYPDNSVDVIYASHVLEHFYYGIDNELINTLKEWHRVLKPHGKLMLSVPDLRVLCWLYLHPDAHPLERHHIMRIMFGGQINIYDVHKVGFDEDTLKMYLEEVGFINMERVTQFNLFNDCSCLKISDTFISLNMIATKV